MMVSEPEKVTAALININNLIEIEEGIQLDEYGYNRNKAEVKEGEVKRNESLYLILQEMDVSPQLIHQINLKAKGVFRSNTLKPGQRFIAYTHKNNEKPHRLILHQNALDYVIFDWEDEINVSTGKKEVTTELMEASGVISSSLYETLLKNEQTTLLGNRLSEIFAWQIDFFRLYPGDNYKVIYEQQYVDEKPYGLGKILAAEFSNKGKTFDAYFFENEERAAYYDRNGNGVQKALLKAPFKFSQRVSSNFSHNRFHPVLKRNIPHYGVDYAAPLGTPVLSVGDGEVIESQYRGANGNIVKIKHNGTYTTAYLHLNGFAKGIRKGVRVKQGQIIGYVGRTGRVTGVHLDYRIYKNGQPVNPLKVELPPSKAISEDDSDAFFERVNSLKDELIKMEEHSTALPGV
ncbi:MAG: peptidoglycan DD-metalloendopeptidase family protein [Balneolaceae bacterium]